MELLIARNHRHDVMLAYARHGVHLELSCRFRLSIAGFGFRLIDLPKNLLAALQITLAPLAQRNPARGPGEQAGTYMPFDIADVARCIGRRRVEVLSRARQAV